MRKFWRKLERSLKLQVMVFAILMFCLSAMYLIIGDWIDKQYKVVNDDYSWVYQVDEFKVENAKLILSGWAFDLDKDAQFGKYEILLREINSGETFYPKMTYTEREDVNRYFLCKYDYTNSGFIGIISAKKLDLENGVYEVLLRPENEKKVYATAIYYANEEMTFANPMEYEPLHVEDTALERVVDEGVLRVYRPDCGMYVYQHDGKLYWIADDNYKFEQINETKIQFHLETTQIDKLPKYRLEGNWYWDNRSFVFEHKEILDENLQEYRVSVCELPKEYSIRVMWTGDYSDSWEWLQHFRPWYEFE